MTMHPIAHQLGRITRMTVERGEFGPDDFKAILTQLASLAKDVLGHSHLVDALDEAHDHIDASSWPDGETVCDQCSGSGEGMTDGSRCMKCRGHGVLAVKWGKE